MLDYLLSYQAMKQLSKGGLAQGNSSVGLGIGLQQMMGVVYSDDLFIPGSGTYDEARRALEARKYRATHFGVEVNSSFSNAKGMYGNAISGTILGGAENRLKPPNLQAAALSTIGPLASLYFIYDGWQQDGFKGAAEALVYDLSVSTATGIYAHEQVIAKKIFKEGGNLVEKFGTRVTMPFGAMGAMGIGIGASIGHDIGKEYLGVPGGVLGAFAGGKLMQMGLKGGWSTVGAIGIAGAAAAVDFGIGMVEQANADRKKLLDVGAAYRRSRRGVDTANNMASFYTMNSNTMRSRAVMAMRNSHMNARSALGMEATFMHSGRDYFSSYR